MWHTLRYFSVPFSAKQHSQAAKLKLNMLTRVLRKALKERRGCFEHIINSFYGTLYVTIHHVLTRSMACLQSFLWSPRGSSNGAFSSWKYLSDCFFFLKMLNSFTNLFTFHRSHYYIFHQVKSGCMIYISCILADCDLARPKWLKSGAKVLKCRQTLKSKQKLRILLRLWGKPRNLALPKVIIVVASVTFLNATTLLVEEVLLFMEYIGNGISWAPLSGKTFLYRTYLNCKFLVSSFVHHFYLCNHYITAIPVATCHQEGITHCMTNFKLCLCRRAHRAKGCIFYCSSWATEGN